jgi:hypothetical protein
MEVARLAILAALTVLMLLNVRPALMVSSYLQDNVQPLVPIVSTEKSHQILVKSAIRLALYAKIQQTKTAPNAMTDTY